MRSRHRPIPLTELAVTLGFAGAAETVPDEATQSAEYECLGDLLRQVGAM